MDCLVRSEFARPGCDLDRCQRRLSTGFVESAASSPDKTALLDGELAFSYGSLLELCHNLTANLLSNRLRDAELIAVILPRGWQQITAVLAILEAGASYVPIEIDTPPERIHAILAQAGIRHAILDTTDVRLAKAIPEHIVQVDFIRSLKQSEQIQIESETSYRVRQLAYVIFTSGSTGTPKGVQISHAAACNTITDINNRFSVSEDDTVFCVSSLAFDLSVYDIFGVLSAGGTLVMSNDQRDIKSWWQALHNQKVTLWNSVPTLMQLLVDYAEANELTLPNSLRLVLLSGDWIPLSLPDRIKKLAPNAQVVSLGGATEVSIWSIFHSIDKTKPDWKSIPYGKALSNQTVNIYSPDLELCAVDEPGEICIGGAGLAIGYLNDPAKTRASFVVHPQSGERLYKTGDLGRMRADGNIEILGRMDHQVKINGNRVELGEIEYQLIHMVGFKSVVVIFTHLESKQRLIAFIVGEETLSYKNDELRTALEPYLPGYMIPSMFVPVPTLPLTNNGKVDRLKLAALAQEAEDAASHPQAKTPELDSQTSTIVARLSTIVAEVMSLSPPSPEENLFDFGATSIDLIMIASFIETDLAVRLPEETFKSHPTILGMAQLIQKHQVG